MKQVIQLTFATFVCTALNTPNTQAITLSEMGQSIRTALQAKGQKIKDVAAQKGSDLTTKMFATRMKNIALCGLQSGVIATAVAYQLASFGHLSEDLSGNYKYNADGSIQYDEKGQAKKIRKTELKVYGKFLARSALSWTAIIAALRSLQKNPVNPFSFIKK